MSKLNIKTNTATNSVTRFIEDGQEVFPCRCGQTHRGDYGLYDYMHHTCFHRANLIDIGTAEWGMKQRSMLMCPDCGLTWNVEEESYAAYWWKGHGRRLRYLVIRRQLNWLGALVCAVLPHAWRDDSLRNNRNSTVPLPLRWFTCTRCGTRCRGRDLGYTDSTPAVPPISTEAPLAPPKDKP